MSARRAHGPVGDQKALPNDPATRERLLESATRLFAERGFARVSVRDICRDAGANGAAVNYHFGSKLGLYTEVVDRAIATMQNTSDATMQATGSAEDRLRHYVRAFMERLVSTGSSAWIHRLMQHEMSEPTPAARRILERAIQPRIKYLSEIVSELLGSSPEDPRVRRSVVSLQAQCLFHARLFNAADPFRSLLFPRGTPRAPDEFEAAVRHVDQFALAGIEGIKDGRTVGGSDRRSR